MINYENFEKLDPMMFGLRKAAAITNAETKIERRKANRDKKFLKERNKISKLISRKQHAREKVAVEQFAKITKIENEAERYLEEAFFKKIHKEKNKVAARERG